MKRKEGHVQGPIIEKIRGTKIRNIRKIKIGNTRRIKETRKIKEVRKISINTRKDPLLNPQRTPLHSRRMRANQRRKI